MQLNHKENKFKPKKNNVILICDKVTNPANIGSLFRLCDAFGIHQIIFYDYKPDLNLPKTKRTARNTILNTEVKYLLENEDNLTELKNKYKIIALEITDDSNPIHKNNLKSNKPIALVIGNERYGIDEKLLNIADQKIHIEMFGKNSSMNVANATSIALYELTKN